MEAKKADHRRNLLCLTKVARQFEGKTRDALATLEKLGDTDWKKVTAAEKWTVGVTAHHLAGALEAVAGIVTGIVSGAPSPGNFTRGQGVRRVGAAGNDDEGHPKEGEKSDDEAHGRDT